jgi:uncharacterized protein (TIGR00297 family)
VESYLDSVVYHGGLYCLPSLSLFKVRKESLAEKFSKGHQRDLGQVLANGGIGTFLAIVFLIFNGDLWTWFAFVGAMAAVNADTWATEIGILNPTNPRLITNWKAVKPGTSGGVSATGILASFAGSSLIGIIGAVFTPADEAWIVFLAAVLGGMVGSIFDSFLGATVQAIYYCPLCKTETERHPQHTCSSLTHQIHGWSWLNNDLVNFFASMIGAVISIGLWLLVD